MADNAETYQALGYFYLCFRWKEQTPQAPLNLGRCRLPPMAAERLQPLANSNGCSLKRADCRLQRSSRIIVAVRSTAGDNFVKFVANLFPRYFGPPRKEKASPPEFLAAGFPNLTLPTWTYLIGTKPTCRTIFWPAGLVVKSRNAFATPLGSPFV